MGKCEVYKLYASMEAIVSRFVKSPAARLPLYRHTYASILSDGRRVHEQRRGKDFEMGICFEFCLIFKVADSHQDESFGADAGPKLKRVLEIVLERDPLKRNFPR